jgi:sarcosine oxidase, subunit alpha
MSGYRLATVPPDAIVPVRFDGRPLAGRTGETFAATLLANGVRTVARSFKYHRPRGIVGFGWHEPNALVQTRDGVELATRLAVTAGLEARAVNCWPSAALDVASVLGAFGAFMPAGFYYKTFRGPRGRAWHLFEPAIRALAGLGKLPEAPDPLACEKRFAHCDVLVIGGGAAGLAAAIAASAAKDARVWLLDDSAASGGALQDRPDAEIDGIAASDWIARTLALLHARGVRILRRTMALGLYDGGLIVALEDASAGGIEKRLWKIRAKALVLATGAFERPFVFADNDRPGVMLLSAALTYARRFAVACGRDVAVIANNDEAYDDAAALAATGVRVSVLVDIRPAADPVRVAAVRAAGVAIHAGHAAIAALGSPVHGLRIAPIAEPGRTRDLSCDTIAMAGGWTPAVHLHSHAGGRLAFDPCLSAFVPTGPHDGAFSAGACNGRGDIAGAVVDGRNAGIAAAKAAGFDVPERVASVMQAARASGILARWEMPKIRRGKAFVDFGADVTADDLRLAVQEGYDAVELLKRYTTTGMAPDQGRFGNMNAIDALARAREVSPAMAGTTTYRPPFVPVAFAALADAGGVLLRPSRTTTLTALHEAAGAVMYESGANWRRPGYYPRSGETLESATRRECRAVRQGVGLYDSSPLGKFEIGGRDAAAFLDFVYATRLSNLKPGLGRYALQLHEDGRIFDDGIVFRMAPDRFFVTTTTGNADACLQRFEYCRQILRPDLKVFILPVTEQWADLVLCGPQARAVLAEAGAVLPADFPFMSLVDARIGGQAVRVARAGFTGELSFEIFLPAQAAPALWTRLLEAGARHGITMVGSEANHVLRIEKGFISVGHEGDGIADPQDLGLGFAVHADKPDFIGRQALLRNRADPSGRPQLVGLLSRDARFVLPEGACVLKNSAARGRGYVTASCWSDALGRSLALALIEDGRGLVGSDVTVALADGVAGARVVAPAFYDPKGGRQRG